MVEAAVICERTIGPDHPSGQKKYARLTSRLVWKTGEKYAWISSLFSYRFYAIWSYSLEMCSDNDEPLNYWVGFQLETFTWRMAEMLEKRDQQNKVGFLHLFEIFEKGVEEVIKGHRAIHKGDLMSRQLRVQYEDSFTGILISVIQLMHLTIERMPSATEDDEAEFKLLVNKLVELDVKDDYGHNLLEMVSTLDELMEIRTDNAHCPFPCDKCIDFLTELQSAE